tara:strand:+ start:1074 stop:1241 length:168 start_codon:yes stop_codon:yes gene_type:complete
MSIGFFITGGIIFAIYMALMIWNIVYSSKKQQEENYPNLDPSDPVVNPPNPNKDD